MKSKLLMTVAFIGCISLALQSHMPYNVINTTASLTIYSLINRDNKTYVQLVFPRSLTRLRRQSLRYGCIMPSSTRKGTYSLRGQFTPTGGQLVPYNSILELECAPGYIISSRYVNVCDFTTNEWLYPLAICQKTCKPPRSLTVVFTCTLRGKAGELKTGNCESIVASGTVATGVCREKHYAETKLREIHCVDGQWKSSMPKCVPVCGHSTPNWTPHVLNGTNAIRGEFPWHVALYTKYGQEGTNLSPKYSCGGSCIRRSLVITAAHCVFDHPKKIPSDTRLFTVAIGKVYSNFINTQKIPESAIQISGIKRIEVPRDYSGVRNSYSHDIAILVLDTPFTFSDIIMPVCLDLIQKLYDDDDETTLPLNARVAGFGLVDVYGKEADVLKTAEMPIISKERCKKDMPARIRDYIGWDKLCAGRLDGVGVCSGDSGGGLVVSATESNRETWYLVGIVSSSPTAENGEKCSTNTYATFTKPILHKDFIDNVIYQLGCEMPKNPSNGTFVLVGLKNAIKPGDGVAHKSEIELICDLGFIASDSEYNLCDEFIDDWTREFATCIPVSPSDLSPYWINPTPSPVTYPTATISPVDVTTAEPAKPEGENRGNFTGEPHKNYKMICYFTNWAWYRQGLGKYVPENINISLCSHIVYGLVVLDAKKLIIKDNDVWTDIDNKFFEKVTSFKKMGAKVILAIGGSADSAFSDKYSRLVSNPEARKRFGNHALKFLIKHNFDGLNFDWKSPVCWQEDCNKGFASDKEGFVALIKELHELFRPKNLLISTTFSTKKHVIDNAYDIPSLIAYVDWIGVTCYNYHQYTDNKTGHPAPLYQYPGDGDETLNINFTINYLISKGASPSKLIVGIALYGRSFALDNPEENGLNAVTYDGGEEGDFTFNKGFLSYYEICDRIKTKQWKVVRDPEGRIGPYAYKGEQWVSFDDAAMIQRKISYLKTMGLGGAMVWSLDYDDFHGVCDCEAYPLLSTAARGLGLIKTTNPNCTMASTPASTRKTMMPRPLVTELSAVPSTTSDYKIICHFANGAWYRKPDKYTPEDIDPSLCTHIIYGYAVLDPIKLTITTQDFWLDIINNLYQKVTALSAKGVKVLIAIGGWVDSRGDKYSRMVSSPQSRANFIASVIGFIEKWNFDGLELDWRYPRCWQNDCNLGPTSDKSNFTLLVRELRDAFTPRGWLLSSLISGTRATIKAAYDIPSLAKDLDWIVVKTYDYHNQKTTNHLASLYQYPGDIYGYFNVNFSMSLLMQMGAPAKKMLMGVPTFGQSFTLSNPSNYGLNAAVSGPGEAGESTFSSGLLAYYEICERVKKRGWSVDRSLQDQVGPWVHKDKQWVSLDDTHLVATKTEFAKNMGLGGVMIWSMDMDDFQNRCGCGRYPILRTINAVFKNSPLPTCDL